MAPSIAGHACPIQVPETRPEICRLIPLGRRDHELSIKEDCARVRVEIEMCRMCMRMVGMYSRDWSTRAAIAGMTTSSDQSGGKVVD